MFEEKGEHHELRNSRNDSINARDQSYSEQRRRSAEYPSKQSDSLFNQYESVNGYTDWE